MMNCAVSHAAQRGLLIVVYVGSRKVDVWLPGKGNPNSRGARPVHLTITIIEWIRTSRLSVKNFLSLLGKGA